jgi:hypothetical protein
MAMHTATNLPFTLALALPFASALRVVTIASASTAVHRAGRAAAAVMKLADNVVL